MSSESVASAIEWFAKTPNLLAVLSIGTLFVELARIVRDIVGTAAVRGYRAQLKTQTDLIREQLEFIKRSYDTLLGRIVP